jgi:type IV pilus assembly protein PilB
VIGFEPDQISQIENSLFFRSGLCLVTGPTGSGKSNTLEAMLRKVEQIHEGRVNVIQIGNPIEFPNEKRLQIPLKTDSDWARAFNATLRMDPDILSPGEFRNASEAAVVFQAAATGHLTLTTLHTNNVAQTFSRLDFLGIERDKQAALLKLIASQELVPLLCPHCKEPDPRGREIADRLCELVFPDREDLRAAIASVSTLPFYHRVGCGRCNNRGIKLRTCIAEVLTVTPDISSMLRNKVDGDEIVKHAIRRHGMITLAEAAARKLCRGQIGYDDVFHLLMSTSAAAPDTPNYSWQSPAEPPPYVDAEVVNDEYIDADIEYAENQKRAAA